MNKQAEYTVVTGGDFGVEQAIATLEKRVRQKLAEGWRAQGGVATSDDVTTLDGKPKRFYVFLQAMVKE